MSPFLWALISWAITRFVFVQAFAYLCGMIKYKIAYKYFTRAQVASMFGYSSVESFSNSSSYDRHMRGVEAVVVELEKMFVGVLDRAKKDLVSVISDKS